MTVSVPDSLVRTFAGDGSTTAFSYPIRFDADDELVVLIRDSGGNDTTQILPTHYTVSGEGDDAGGTVTFTTAPVSGETVVIYRATKETQTVDLYDSARNSADSVELQLDRIVRMVQDHSELHDRAVKVRPGSTAKQFPEPAADKFIGWNSAADGLENKTTANLDGETLPATASRYLKRNAGGTAFDAVTAAQVADDLKANLFASPVITTPQINDASADHQYVLAVSELAADRTVTLPLLSTNDEFVFKNHAQVLTNKTLVDINGGPLGGFRNKTINGNFDIWQRGFSFTAGGYTADRWRLNEGSGAACTISRQNHTIGQTDVPGEPKHFLRFARGTAGTAASYVEQRIEGVRSFAGQKATVTFYAKAAAATELEVDLIQDFGAGGSSDVVTEVASAISIATAYQKFTYAVDVPSISGKSFGISSDDFLGLRFARDHDASNPTTSVDISRVSIVPGDATNEDDPFEPRPLGAELALCQRYYEYINEGDLTGFGASTTAAICHWSFAVTKRAPFLSLPAVTGPASANAFGFRESDGAGGLTVVSSDLEFGSVLQESPSGAVIAVSGGTGLTNHRPGFVYLNGGYFAAEAEL